MRPLAVFAVIQARDAKLTAKAAMNSQRAWILLESIKAPDQIHYLENEYRASPRLEFKFKVFGVVPIKIIKSQIRLHFVQLKSDSSNEPDLPIPPPTMGKSPDFSRILELAGFIILNQNFPSKWTWKIHL